MHTGNLCLSKLIVQKIQKAISSLSFNQLSVHNNVILPCFVGPKKKHGGEKESFAPALIIGLLLVVPVILLVIITIIVRLYQTGKYFV